MKETHVIYVRVPYLVLSRILRVYFPHAAIYKQCKCRAHKNLVGPKFHIFKYGALFLMLRRDRIRILEHKFVMMTECGHKMYLFPESVSLLMTTPIDHFFNLHKF